MSSLHSGRNLGLVAALLGSLAILLALAAYLATKYRAKQPAPVGIVTIYHYCSLYVFHLVGNILLFVKLRQGSGKDRQGMAVKAKGLKA